MCYVNSSWLSCGTAKAFSTIVYRTSQYVYRTSQYVCLCLFVCLLFVCLLLFLFVCNGRSEFYSQVQVLLNEKGEEKVQKEQYKMEVSRLTEQKRVLEEETTKVCTGFQDEAKEAWLNYEQLEEKSRSDSKEIKELRNKIRDYTNRLDDYQKEKITLNGMVKELEAKRKELEAKYRQLDEGSKSAIQGLKDENMANQISVSGSGMWLSCEWHVTVM